MTVETGYKHIVRAAGVYGGKPCIENHRISVHDIAVYTSQGQTPTYLAEAFGLTLAQVYAALTYYYDHKEEIDREIKEEDACIAAQADVDTSPVAERMRQALAERKKHSADG
ncbi:MAG TPA: DUF433 domain-containing protein [Ktedonobacterales bacterium]|nr:DUF433 domain-containing protein [Ktedonobacterales bacterium]